MTRRLRKINLPSPTPIVRDGAVAQPGLGEGRLIPVLIVDTTIDKHLGNLIRLHETSPPGDISVLWLSLMQKPHEVLLEITFDRPAVYHMVLSFDILKEGGVVDGILHAHGFIMVAGAPGDTVVGTLDNPRIVLEIPDTGFLPCWNEMYSKVVIKHFRKNGVSKKKAIQAAGEHIKMFREVWQMRGHHPE